MFTKPRRTGPSARRRSSSNARRPALTARVGIGTLLLVLLASCGDEEAALRVDGASFTEDDLLGLSGERRTRLAELTALGLAFARDEAERAGAPLLERRREDLLLERFRASLVLERRDVGDDVLRAQYETDPRYELVVRHVVALADAQDPDSVHEAARARAERALERIESGEPMAEVAAELSEEPGAAERGGRLQPGREGSWVPEFWRAANALEEGEHSGVVRSEYGYHVIQLEERRVVPFEEVRSEVVLSAGRMIGGMEEAWVSWSDSVAAGVRIDSAALGGWLEGAPMAVDTAATTSDVPPGAGEREASGDVLARVGGGGSGAAYMAGDFLRHAVSLEEGAWRRLVEADPAEAGAELREEAVRRAASRAARDRGLAVPPGEEERLAREWRNQVASWAVSLGFQPGAAAGAVGERALEALSTTRQNATIARGEVEPRGPLLRAAYRIRGLERETGASSGS